MHYVAINQLGKEERIEGYATDAELAGHILESIHTTGSVTVELPPDHVNGIEYVITENEPSIAPHTYNAEEEAAANAIRAEYLEADADGNGGGSYPTEAALQRIREWSLVDDARQWHRPHAEALLEFVRALWAYADTGWEQRGDYLYVSTYGWSGNEDLVRALQDNAGFFWHQCWVSTRAGGHYEFSLDRFPAQEAA